MKLKISNRQSLSAAIIVFYLIPLFFFSAYSIKLMSQNKSWTLLSLGLLMVVFGTLSLIFLLSYWEESLRNKKSLQSLLLSQESSTYLTPEVENKVTLLDPTLTFGTDTAHEISENGGFKESSKELNLLQTALESSQKKHEELTAALEGKIQELHKQEEENKQLQLKAQQTAQDFSDYKLFSEEQLKQKQLQLNGLQQLLEDQRAEMEKRQEQIHQLDTKVHDLSYEIKTLLYLHEEEGGYVKGENTKEEKFSYPLFEEQIESEDKITNPSIIETPSVEENLLQENAIHSPGEAALFLKKCIGIAQKLTGANYYSNESSRYREFPSSYLAIDQRRLFENLRGESGALVIVYSQKEQKVLFVNNETKGLLGWSPEKFLNQFTSIMQEGMQDWNKALHALATASESQVRLLAKTKQGQEVMLNCHLGVIHSGLFRNYVIGVLYPT